MFLVVNQRSRGEGRILRENVRFSNVKIMLFENWRISEFVEECDRKYSEIEMDLEEK